MWFACRMTKAKIHTHSHTVIIFNIYCSPTAKVVTRTHLIITLYYVNCLSIILLENGWQTVHKVERTLGCSASCFNVLEKWWEGDVLVVGKFLKSISARVWKAISVPVCVNPTTMRADLVTSLELTQFCTTTYFSWIYFSKPGVTKLLQEPHHTCDRGGTVVKVLCYKSEARWFDPRWCQWNFSLT